ncbi:putative ribosomal N-acetyltransferase YdaF [Abditibacteriota bacterium]|nr:putative ribosomal N-acetyltransferase YdaF [Abditibacteriota bacterium]
MAFRDAFKEFPIIETERLVLRNLRSEDAEEYYCQLRSAFDSPSRPPWAYGFELRSVEAVRDSIKFTENAWKKKARIKWGLCLKNGEFVGQCELYDFANQVKAEIGYWLGAVHQNQGLMSEAITAVVDYAFGPMGMNRIYAKTATKNTSSIAMLRKVGFVQEGILRQDGYRDGLWTDTALMAILSSDL